MFTLAVKDLYSSYKDLPLSIYQIQTKYRDEARPRAGVLRGREFVMKDSYSFDIDEAGLDKSYQLHRDAYVRIFDRLGFHYVIVQAMAGAMGGSKSEEFLATAENGEDTYVRCTNCGYAANVEAVRVPVPDAVDASGVPAAHVEDTPDTPTIDTLVAHLESAFPRSDGPALGGRRTRSRTSSWCSCTPTAPASRSPSACPATARSTRSGSGPRSSRPTVEAFDEKDFAANPALAKGYIGPGVLGAEKASGIRYLLDPRVSEGTRVGHRRRRGRAATSSTSWPAATSPPTAPSRPPRCATATPAPRAGTAWSRRAASRWATSSSSAPSTPRRST